MSSTTKSHDLRLPDWGPYTKNYMGITHIANKKYGIGYDLAVYPMRAGEKWNIIMATEQVNYIPWEASSDLSYFSVRYQMDSKDMLYCDVSFSAIDENSRLLCCECVNNTDNEETVDIQLMSYITYPTMPNNKKAIQSYYLKNKEKFITFDARDYEDLQYAKQRPTDNLVPDARKRGEVQGDGYSYGGGLGTICVVTDWFGFGSQKNDRISYVFYADKAITSAVLAVRYRIKGENAAAFQMKGISGGILNLEASEEFTVKKINIGKLHEGNNRLELISLGGADVDFDYFVICEECISDEIEFAPVSLNYKPAEIRKNANSVILKYKDIEGYYGISLLDCNWRMRSFEGNNLNRFADLIEKNKTEYKAEGDIFYLNTALENIKVKAKGSKRIYAVVMHGTYNEVESVITGFENYSYDVDNIYDEAQKKAVKFDGVLTSGTGYINSQTRMAAAMMTNIVYPIQCKGEYIRHSTPGKCWDSLYTWDSGFIGLGLSELDKERAWDNLNAYVTELGDKHNAFIHHGSPVPVQFYLFLEMWNKTQSQDLLEYFYPRLKQYYEFFVGKAGSSTTNTLSSGLLKTWDYFYSSGGWDDYPPQIYVNENDLRKTAAPMITTSHAVRIGKIMKMAAMAINLHNDAAEYDKDIQSFTGAVLNNGWDEESGYFGYVVHKENGTANGILRYKDGSNFDMGMDGAYPVIAGITNKNQTEKLIGHLKTEGEIWSRIGLSAVDARAGYYNPDGYWNGSVWMPHQWFFWKAMLTLGEGDFAAKIAHTALNLWKENTDRDYKCYESFRISSGIGKDWQPFTGLSCPVINWFNAYYVTGKLTCGYDMWIEELEVSRDKTRLNARIINYGEKGCSAVVAVMPDKFKYDVRVNGEKVKNCLAKDGFMNIYIDNSIKNINLTICAEQ